MRLNFKHYFLQAILYSVVFLVIALFSNFPPYEALPENSASIKISLRHAGKLIGTCRERSAEELKQLPPNMRAPKVCPRERSPLKLELLVNNDIIYAANLKPSGWQNDGTASHYKRLTISAGEVTLKVRMKDHVDQTDFPYALEKTINLTPGQALAIDFNNNTEKFEFL